MRRPEVWRCTCARRGACVGVADEQVGKKPRSHRSELEKGDSRAFLFETIVRYTYPQKCITFTKKNGELVRWFLWQEQTVSTWVAPARWRLRCVKSDFKKKCQTRTVTSIAVFFFFFFACVHHVGLPYISSDLRTCTQRMFARSISVVGSTVRAPTVRCASRSTVRPSKGLPASCTTFLSKKKKEKKRNNHWPIEKSKNHQKKKDSCRNKGQENWRGWQDERASLFSA